MKYIVYKTTCLINNKIYIGVHHTNNEKYFDKYLGCGVYSNKPSTYKNPNTPFKKAVAKYGPENFNREIIATYDKEEDAYKLEETLVNEDFLKRKDVYNLTLGGKFHDSKVQHKKVYMYDLNGNFVKEFDSVNSAGRFLNPYATGAGHLPRAIKNGHQYLGFQFSYVKLDSMQKLKHRNLINGVCKPYIGKPVGKYTKNWKLIKRYENMTECVKDGYKNAKLVAEGKRNFCNGYRFKYID